MSGNETETRHQQATEVVHEGRDPHSHHGFVNTPVFRGSTVLFKTVAELKAYKAPYTYGRRATPTTRALETALAKLEGGVDTILTASGYQAVTTALLAFAEAGDHVLIADSVYQPTRKFCDVMLKRLGVDVEYYDPLVGGGIERLMRANTRLVFAESPGSLTFEMQDIPAIAKVARKRDVWVIMDNTWASPLLFKPLAHGVDVSIQSATKYIVGHADALLGAIICNERALAHVTRAKEALGVCPGSEEVWLALRGLRTLDVRLKRHEASGLALARWLEQQTEVARVIHPALPSHPGHAIWKRDFSGASGLFSVVLKPVPEAAVEAMLNGLRLFGMGYSWGGYESLVVPFDAATSRSATRWAAEGPTIRIHVGLEDVEDLKMDLEAGFARLRAVAGASQ